MHSFLTLDQLPPTHRVWVDAALTAVKANPEPNSVSGSPDGVTVYRVSTTEYETDRYTKYPNGVVTFSPSRLYVLRASRPGEADELVGLEGGHLTRYASPKTWLGRPVVYAEGVA